MNLPKFAKREVSHEELQQEEQNAPDFESNATDDQKSRQKRCKLKS